MAYQGVIDTGFRPEVEGLVALLEEFVTQWAGARSLEERALIESEALSLFSQLIDLEYEYDEVRAGQHPEWTEFDGVYEQYAFLYRVNVAKLQKLGDMFLKYFNTQQLMLTELLGKLKRIRQKRAALTLWQEGEAKFVLADRFLNLDWVDSAFSTEPICEVQSAQGVLTLPVKGTTPVVPLRARIGKNSNGVPGNSDTAVTQNNSNPEFALNTNPNNWFEYERLDAGPLDLVYVCEFAREEVVNQISIEALNLRSGYNFEVVDITFTTSGQTSKSIRERVPGSTEPGYWTVRSLGNDTSWNVSFLPVQAKSITLHLRQHSSMPLSVVSSDDRTIVRQRWAIALKRVEFLRVQYDKTGSINSVEQSYPAGVYGALPFADVLPSQPELFDACLEVSLDGGETWSEATNVDDGIGSTVLLDGTAGSLIWRLRLERDDDAIANVTSFLPVVAQVKEVQSMLRTASRFESPTALNLVDKPFRGEVFAFQPQLGRRGDRFNAVVLGNSSTGVSSFQLPFSALEGGVDPASITVFVNRRPYIYQQDNSVLTPGEWSFSDDLREIEFASSLPIQAEISMVFDEELMHFEQRGDGYYHTMEMLFDGDKGNVRITALPRTAGVAVEVLPRDQTLIQLPHKNIVSGSFALQSRQGTVYTEVTNRTAVVSTTNSYMVDYVNGLLWLNAAFGIDTVWANYQQRDPITLGAGDFDVFYDKLRPAGVRIKPEAFQSLDTTDTVGSGPQVRLDVLTGLTVARDNTLASATNAMTLTHERVVIGSVDVSTGLLGTDATPEEVGFIDGRSEFLGLVRMRDEQTVALTATGTYVEFNLAAGSLWDTDMGVLFGNTTVFANKVGTAALAQAGTTGDYHVAESGLVTLNVGTGGSLAAGITITYLYRDPSFDPSNKYSVDYKRGALYGYQDLVAGSTVTYKTANYKVAYDICREIDEYSYDKQTNTVSVRTEGLKDINRLVKVLWHKAEVQENLSGLAQYFSPLMSILAFRFS